MKKTTFKDIDLAVSITYNQTYLDYLESNGIKYYKRSIPIFQPLLPREIIFYGGYEVTYRDKNGSQKFAYPFITEKADSTKCVTFFPENKVDNLYLLDLEQALRTEQLVFENVDADENKFQGFDFSVELKIEDLLDKVVYLEDGSTYEFTTVNEFPEGITGKKVFPNGNVVPVFLAKAAAKEPCLMFHEAGSGWKILDKDTIIAVFGAR